jgi:ethanolamine ammonia-lyase large subunit
MRITEIFKENDNSADNEEVLNLEEVEKTAEVLEKLSEEDTLLDDLAKLAVLQDVLGKNKEYLEKQASFLGFGEKTTKQLAKATKAKAAKDLSVAEILDEASKLELEAKNLRGRAEARLSGGQGSLLSSAAPFIVGGAAGAAGAGVYFKNRENKMLEEIANYYNSRTSVQQ